MHRKTEKTLCILLLTMFISAAALNNTTASANQTKLYVDPQSIVDPTLVPGENFTINITIANVTNLYSFEFKLSFNSTILNALEVELGDFFPTPENVSIIEPPWINNTAGYIHFGAKITGCELPRSGGGTLSVVTFQVMDVGYSALNLYDTHITDSWSDPIPHETFEGYFNNVLLSRRDVAVINVTPSHTEAYTGRVVNVTATVKNKGDIAETFDVNAYYDNNLIGTLTVTDLASREQANLTFSWNTEGVQPCISYTIKAEANPVPNEINMTDNIYVDGMVKIKILGDINGDGVVDILDVVEAALAFGAYPGHPRWNPDADLMPDDVIDIFDLVLIMCRDSTQKKCAR